MLENICRTPTRMLNQCDGWPQSCQIKTGLGGKYWGQVNMNVCTVGSSFCSNKVDLYYDIDIVFTECTKILHSCLKPVYMMMFLL